MCGYILNSRKTLNIMRKKNKYSYDVRYYFTSCFVEQIKNQSTNDGVMTVEAPIQINGEDPSVTAATQAPITDEQPSKDINPDNQFPNTTKQNSTTIIHQHEDEETIVPLDAKKEEIKEEVKQEPGLKPDYDKMGTGDD